MRKTFLFLMVALAFIASSAWAGTPSKESELPKEAKTFIAKYFANDRILKVEKEDGRRGTEYEVDFVSGAELNFKSDGSWKEVKVKRGQAVPDAIVPDAILSFVKTNHKGKTIREISMKRGHYEVELSDGTELKLTKEAKPVTDQGRGQHGNRPRR